MATEETQQVTYTSYVGYNYKALETNDIIPVNIYCTNMSIGELRKRLDTDKSLAYTYSKANEGKEYKGLSYTIRNSLIISSPTSTSNVDAGTPAIIMSDYQGNILPLTYSISVDVMQNGYPECVIDEDLNSMTLKVSAEPEINIIQQESSSQTSDTTYTYIEPSMSEDDIKTLITESINIKFEEEKDPNLTENYLLTKSELDSYVTESVDERFSVIKELIDDSVYSILQKLGIVNENNDKI